MILTLRAPIQIVPSDLAAYSLALADDGNRLIYTYNTHHHDHDVADLMQSLGKNNIYPKDIESRQSSLEEIFIQLVEA